MSLTKVTAEGLGALNSVNLEAYNNTSTITGNAVDIFIYDTSKDSDGGAWRKRTQDTSWYNETASTTRGSRKDFPAVAVIVAESNKVTIYDGDTPDLDMWMVFNSGVDGSNETLLRYASIKANSMMNGILCVATQDTTPYISFIDEYHNLFHTSNSYYFPTRVGIVDRNVIIAEPTMRSGGIGLVSTNCNDVAMTVLPNAPIDSATGLPTPTIAVATNGGVSVIKDDGTVVDITAGSGSNYSGVIAIDIDDSYNLIFEQDSQGRALMYIPIPSADRTTQTSDAAHTDKRMHPTSSGGTGSNHLPKFSGSNASIYKAGKGDDQYIYGGVGLTAYKYGNTKHKSSVAYITSKYNTGYMTGDIRGAWNVDTDVTTLGAELAGNATFRTDARNTSHTYDNGDTTFSLTGDSDSTNAEGYVWIYLKGTAGKYYTVTIQSDTATTTESNTRLVPDNSGSLAFSDQGTTLSRSLTYRADSPNDGLIVYGDKSASTTVTYTVSIKEAIPDRSVKGNGLAVHGTPTVSAVATDAELKCIQVNSGNCLLAPYNSNYNVGSTWHFGIWIMRIQASTWDFVLGYDHTTNAHGNGIRWDSPSGASRLRVQGISGGGNTFNNHPNDELTNVWQKIDITSDGTTVKVYRNGAFHESDTYAPSLSLPTDWNYVIGAEGNSTAGGFRDGREKKVALTRISATAPTAEQIKEIYEAEKPLFQENAKCTLNGTSDAVTAMSYDDSNEELLVGTSGGLSVFKGLRRVDENTNNITEVAQQGGLRVEEY